MTELLEEIELLKSLIKAVANPRDVIYQLDRIKTIYEEQI